MGSAGEQHRQSTAGSANAQESINQTSPSRKRKRQVAVSSLVSLWCDPAAVVHMAILGQGSIHHCAG